MTHSVQDNEQETTASGIKNTTCYCPNCWMTFLPTTTNTDSTQCPRCMLTFRVSEQTIVTSKEQRQNEHRRNRSAQNSDNRVSELDLRADGESGLQQLRGLFFRWLQKTILLRTMVRWQFFWSYSKRVNRMGEILAQQANDRDGHRNRAYDWAKRVVSKREHAEQERLFHIVNSANKELENILVQAEKTALEHKR